jgi:hypothetical protein
MFAPSSLDRQFAATWTAARTGVRHGDARRRGRAALRLRLGLLVPSGR